MEQRINIITLGVNDLQKSRIFYDSLGWQVVTEEQSDEIICYNLQSMALALFPWEKLAEDAGVSPNRSGYSSFTIAYNVNSEIEVETILEQAHQAGAKIIKPAQKVFWGGYSGYFSDPDNHLWEVAYNPFSKLGPNGEFQWGGA